MKLTIKPGCADAAYLSRVFAWLSRIGASPKFGSRPIGWYQQHQMAVLTWLEKSEAANREVRCKDGTLQAKDGGKWIAVTTVNALYSIGDGR